LKGVVPLKLRSIVEWEIYMDLGKLRGCLDRIVATQLYPLETFEAVAHLMVTADIFDSEHWKVLEAVSDEEIATRLRIAYRDGGRRAFRRAAKRAIQDETFGLPKKAAGRLRKLTSLTIRGSLGEKLAFIRETERVIDLDKTNDFLAVALAYRLVDLIPVAADRAGKIAVLVTKEATSKEAESYLEEACYCYLYGLGTACAITCRSVLEEAIEQKLSPNILSNWRTEETERRRMRSRRPSGDRQQEEPQPTLGILLELSQHRDYRQWSLPALAKAPAIEVLKTGNRAAHKSPIDDTEALKCFSAARKALSLILGGAQ
jgi:hypothetical protein